VHTSITASCVVCPPILHSHLLPEPPPFQNVPTTPFSPAAEYPLRISIDFHGSDAQPLPKNEEPASPTQILHVAGSEIKSLWDDWDIRAALYRSGGSASPIDEGGSEN
jgi:hypothetical protein